MSGGVSPDIVRKWQSAVEAVEDEKFGKATSLFWEIRNFSAKIWFNLGIVDILQNNFLAADEKLKECLQRDDYLAVAHFQRGVIACQQGRLTEGRGMFADALRNLRNSESIDYKQLGLDLCLSRQQVQHNQMTIDKYLTANRPTTKIPENELKTLPAKLFRPARSLVDNVEKKQFLPAAKVISAVPDIVQKKDGNRVIRAQSSSAPTSPSALRRQALPPPPPPSHAHGSFTPPPPSRPPPRLPPSTQPRCHDNGARLEAVPKRRDGQTAAQRRHLQEDTGSSCSQTSVVALEGLIRNRLDVSGRTTRSAGCVCRCADKGGETSSRHHARSCAMGDNSLSDQSAAIKNKPVTEKASDPVREVIKALEKNGDDNKSSQGRSTHHEAVRSSAVHAMCRRHRTVEEVSGLRPRSEGGAEGASVSASARQKPARPPPPKFGS
ncbi:uncharacterized protein LOC143276264 [Babylonia areolata]|uniref:uncharacterized protein LOC143276264 n=1 Tax=Babylonia areolata TaxID=304850 RepID=UPI003FD338E8